MIIINSLVRLGVTSGLNSLLLGFVLLMSVAIDVRWLKNRHKVLSKVYVSPTYAALPPVAVEIHREPLERSRHELRRAERARP